MLVALTISFTIAARSADLTSGLKSLITTSTGFSFTPKAFGFKAITLASEVRLITAKALPEKAVFLTENPPSKLGNSTAPSTNPALSFTAILGDKPLPENELDNTTMFAPSFCVASAITAA
ncbi:hypothetical protein D9M68_773630 [compost metagenome]